MKVFFRATFSFLLASILTCLPTSAQDNGIDANNSHVTSASADSTDCSNAIVSLLTCQPGNETYSLYGHTALRYYDPSKGMDYAINYGVFDFNKPFFTLRFVFGLTDYEMGISSFKEFCLIYDYLGRGVTEQVLNLTAKEKEQIFKAIEENFKPENRVYRYNYFYNNCTTKARDIICSNIDGKVVYKKPLSGMTFRELIHKYTNGHPWAELGNDLLLGIGSDQVTNRNEQQFLPYYLLDDLNSAVIINNEGKTRQFVLSEREVVSYRPSIIESGFPLSPIACASVIFAIILCFCIVDLVTHRISIIFDIILMALIGITGTVLCLMLFSQHPTVRLNIQMLLFNPLPLFFIRNVFKTAKNNKSSIWWPLSIAMNTIFLILALTIQCCNIAVIILSIGILIRSVSHVVQKQCLPYQK